MISDVKPNQLKICTLYAHLNIGSNNDYGQFCLYNHRWIILKHTPITIIRSTLTFCMQICM